MNTIDILLIGATSAVTLCLIFIPRYIKGMLPYWILLLILLAIVQFLLKGYYWQYIPTYLLLVILVGLTFFSKKNNSILSRKLFRITLFLFLLLAIMPWTLLTPIPKLTKPESDYAVGTRIFRWIDTDRAELITNAPDDKRNVIVQAWYPTEINAMSNHSAYLDGLKNLPAKIGVMPKFLFQHYDEIDTYGVMNAPISKAKKQWPVIIFLPGYGAPRAVYTSLSAGLASHGYVVLTIDHPYESAITALSNGEIVTTIEDFSKYPNRLDFMANRLDVRVADVQFVINQIHKQSSSAGSFFSSLDTNRIAAAGHSFGGASSAVAMMYDLRIKAAANIDGTLYGELPKPNGTRPFLLLESNKADTNNFVRYEKGNKLLFEQFGGGYRYEMTNADHYSFTDVPYFMASPARLLAGQALKFGQIPKTTHQATVEILNTFFKHSLSNIPPNIDSVANHYQGIIRKVVK